MPKDLVFFTHIPKTSGTTFFHSSFLPNVAQSEVYRVASIRKVLSDHWSGKLKVNDLKVVSGHFKYGMHHLFNCNPRYIVFLRDPIDRAVSFYYFIKDSNISIYRHPVRAYADSVSIEEFYQNPKFSNMICQQISGYSASTIYQKSPWMFGSKKLLVETASNHLFNQYENYGMLEQFEASRKLLCNRFSLSIVDEELKKQKETGKRPRIEDLSDQTLNVLRTAHELDLELYNRAKSNFFNQFEYHEQESILKNI